MLKSCKYHINPILNNVSFRNLLNTMEHVMYLSNVCINVRNVAALGKRTNQDPLFNTINFIFLYFTQHILEAT